MERLYAEQTSSAPVAQTAQEALKIVQKMRTLKHCTITVQEEGEAAMLRAGISIAQLNS